MSSPHTALDLSVRAGNQVAGMSTASVLVSPGVDLERVATQVETLEKGRWGQVD